jgi:farnesyl diphosphate synthase
VAPPRLRAGHCAATRPTWEVTGKDSGHDAAAGKATVVALLGVAESRRRLEALQRSAAAHLARLDTDTGVLRAVFEFVISRTS